VLLTAAGRELLTTLPRRESASGDAIGMNE
jgi:hypothetical protein